VKSVFKDKKTICVLVLPALLLFFFVVIFPIFMSGYYSTLKWDGIGQAKFIGLKNYLGLLSDEIFLRSVKNSFIIAGVSIFIQLPIALVLAMILPQVKGENFYRTAYFIPVIIASIVIGQLWRHIYHSDYGLLNSVLNSLGLGRLARPWLGDPKMAMGAVCVPIIWQYIGYHMLLFYASAKSIPDQIYEAAKIDGASPVRTAFSITIPLMKPIIEVCVILALIGSLKMFDIVYIMTAGQPMNLTQVPSFFMYQNIFYAYRYGYGSSMAMFIVLECLTFTVLIQAMFRTRRAI
jgi:raffinose/stachyose/melibiose transport system permease protein